MSATKDVINQLRFILDVLLDEVITKMMCLTAKILILISIILK